VVVAGGDEAGHLAEIKAEIGKQKVESDFEFVGEVGNEKKWDLYRSADLFVLPSHSENFGIVVAEALACGVPVIATQGTPWEDLVTQHCGWWPAVGSGSLAEALRAALARTDEERQAMGCRGRQLVEAKYSWPGVAAQMLSVYQWMLGGGQKPECIVE
jgi:glycosyltransferase involved in cell wall biosynthesis